MKKFSEYRILKNDEIRLESDLFFSLKSRRWRRILKSYVGKPRQIGTSDHLRLKKSV